MGDVVKAVIRRVYTDKGIKMELSRTSPKFLECLLEAEVPEIKDGYVSVVKCANSWRKSENYTSSKWGKY